MKTEKFSLHLLTATIYYPNPKVVYSHHTSQYRLLCSEGLSGTETMLHDKHFKCLKSFPSGKKELKKTNKTMLVQNLTGTKPEQRKHQPELQTLVDDGCKFSTLFISIC